MFTSLLTFIMNIKNLGHKCLAAIMKWSHSGGCCFVGSWEIIGKYEKQITWSSIRLRNLILVLSGDFHLLKS